MSRLVTLSLLALVAALPAQDKKALLRPDLIAEDGPDYYRVVFDTNAGPIEIEVTREWAPKGADRFYHLCRLGFYDDTAFFRVLPGFVAQFGLSGDPEINRAWQGARIIDDEVVKSNVKGTLSFAMAGPNSRTTQIFINYGNNARLDNMGFAPFGKVVKGMDNALKIHSKYGQTPRQDLIQSQGNAYLKKQFPDLTFIKKVTILKGVAGMPAAAQEQIKAAQARLSHLYKLLMVHHADQKRLPKAKGPKFFLALWDKKILEHTAEDASVFFCPSTGNGPGKELENVTAAGIDWAGPLSTSGLKPSHKRAKEIVIGAHKVRSGSKAALGGLGVCILRLDGSTGFIPASEFKDGEIVIGPKSSVKSLKRLSAK